MGEMYKNPEKFVRASGTLHNIEDNALNRALMEEIDNHMMAIYRLLKSAYPEKTGFEATAFESKEEEDVVTRFWMLPRPEEEGDK